MTDLHNAGGIPGVLKTLFDGNIGLTDCTTVCERKLSEITRNVYVNNELIRSCSNPVTQKAGLGVLYGNIAQNGCVTKISGIDEKCYEFEGVANPFDSEEEAMFALENDLVKAGDVIIIRYEGPKGGLRMRELSIPAAMLVGMGLHTSCAMVTDGIFSGVTRGSCIGHVVPEARDGDIIEIDIDARTTGVRGYSGINSAKEDELL